MTLVCVSQSSFSRVFRHGELIKRLLPYLIEILQHVNHRARYYMRKFQTQSNLRVFQQSYFSYTWLLQIKLPETPNKITICLQKSVPLLIKEALDNTVRILRDLFHCSL